MEAGRAAVVALLLALATRAAAPPPPRYSSRIVHTHQGAIRGVIVEPASRRLEPVEVFRGVPYAATPPRLQPPPPPPRWPGTRLADTNAPACPHALPDISNRSAALGRMPLGVYNELRAALPLLANQSEDCLYLNIFVPGSGARGVEAPYAVLLVVGGGAGGAIDGAVLAARAHLLVVTLNYRVGLLGYLSSGLASSAAARAGGAGVLDVAAAARWLRREAASFGGDPRRLALLATPPAAATVAALLINPDAKGLISRVMFISGSGLDPAAFQPDATLTRRHAAQALRCSEEPSEAGEHWLEACVRSRPLAALLAVQAPGARFLAGWAPSVPLAADGAPLPPPRALLASDAFLECSLAVVVSTTESYPLFSEDDVRHGFEEEQRNRILRTFVRNVFRYHRNEILAAARNEYTDWEKPIQHPVNIRDATMEALSDAAGAAPALRLAQLHARRGATTYFAHFAHQTKDADYPQRLGSVSGEAVAYFLGAPLVGGAGGGGAGRNYSRADAGVAEACVALLGAFVKTGEPAHKEVAWPRYDMNTQQYLAIGSKVRARSHYRGHKLALWLVLVPQLHRRAPVPPHHHRLRLADNNMFAGEIFPELSTTTVSLDEEEEAPAGEEGEEAVAGEAGEDECAPPPAHPARAATPPPPPRDPHLAALDDHYYSYTVALGVTVGAGCFLLALNVLVFAGIYLQRSRRRTRHHHAGRSSARQAAGSLTCEPGALASPRKSTLKRSSEAELNERAAAAPPKKRVQIQEISV